MRKTRTPAAEAIDIRKMAKEIDVALRRGMNPARQKATVNYYPTALENLGVGAPHLWVVVRDAKRKLEGHPPKAAVSLAHAIVAQGTLEGRQAAYEILGLHQGALGALTRRDVEALGRGMDNWASVDAFCCVVAGHAWRMGGLSDRDIVRWARSKDRWWRRAAIVATVPLNAPGRGGSSDTKRTVRILEMLAHEREPMIAKAVSWALRAMVRSDPKAVRKFLKEHEETLPALVKREVTNKLTTGLKNPGRGKGKRKKRAD